MEKLTYLKRDTTDREGNALTTKDGRPYTRMSIKVDSKGDRYVSGFGTSENAGWKVGDEVDITIVEAAAKDKNGRPYLNFSMPKKEDKIDDKLEMILNRIVSIKLELAAIRSFVEPKKKSYETEEQPPDDEVDPDLVPF